jgi:hypothetical protein
VAAPPPVPLPEPLPADLDDTRARALLEEGGLEVLGRIPWASNATLLAKVCQDGLEGLVVYKPARGEQPLWDFPEGTLYRREVAAYLVSEQLGWGLVPLTVVREDGPFGAGSLQRFVDADLEVTAFELVERGDPAMRLVAAFDVVINNADRKAGHCLLVPGGRVWAIDHGVCFHVEPKLRTVLWDFAGQRLPRRLLDDLRGLVSALDGELGERLAGILAPAEIEALTRRAERLTRSGRFPHPVGRRPYPWPLV